VDYIYASEYLRVKQTAKPLARDKGIAVMIDKRLNEIDNGIVETMSDKHRRAVPEFGKTSTSISKTVGSLARNVEEVKARQNNLWREKGKRRNFFILS
jgi:broad specificity phosphatase PhoE